MVVKLLDDVLIIIKRGLLKDERDEKKRSQKKMKRLRHKNNRRGKKEMELRDDELDRFDEETFSDHDSNAADNVVPPAHSDVSDDQQDPATANSLILFSQTGNWDPMDVKMAKYVYGNMSMKDWSLLFRSKEEGSSDFAIKLFAAAAEYSFRAFLGNDVQITLIKEEDEHYEKVKQLVSIMFKTKFWYDIEKDYRKYKVAAVAADSKLKEYKTAFEDCSQKKLQLNLALIHHEGDDDSLF